MIMFPSIIIEGTDGSGKTNLCRSIRKTVNAYYDNIKTIGRFPAAMMRYHHFPSDAAKEDASTLTNRKEIQNVFAQDIIYYASHASNPFISDRWLFSNLIYSIYENTGIVDDLEKFTEDGVHIKLSKIYEYYGWNKIPTKLVDPRICVLLAPPYSVIRMVSSLRSNKDPYGNDGDIKKLFTIRDMYENLYKSLTDMDSEEHSIGGLVIKNDMDVKFISFIGNNTNRDITTNQLGDYMRLQNTYITTKVLQEVCNWVEHNM